MDLVSWTLNIIDQICFQREDRVKETLFSRRDVLLWIHNGFLAAVEDCVPDYNVGRGRRKCVHIWTFDNRISAFWSWWLPGLSSDSQNVGSCSKLPAMLDGVCRAINTQTEMLREQNRKLDTILEQNRSLAAVGLRG
ncbi:hypothetical protein ILYODFUR_008804 [Ilyodon furcidens]|uniref:Uncharacterized protein n=1 Tax=Ilyodon furcidens TaxID=33524 RepID=A0ABV0VCA6_9TELE